jgi:threonine/homoserine/homoserine lactone efflux protein
MSPELYLAYLVACLVVVIVPGPNVTLIIANGFAHGTRAALLNVAGTQIGLAVMVAIVIAGLATVVEALGWWFDWLRLIGAAYLVWLGWKLLRSSELAGSTGPAAAPRGGFLIQGLLVSLSNPKTLLFFGAFIPQFMDPAGHPHAELLILGSTFMAVAAVSDTLYAVLCGGAGRRISERQVCWLSRISGGVLVGGGIWLALARSK